MRKFGIGSLAILVHLAAIPVAVGGDKPGGPGDLLPGSKEELRKSVRQSPLIVIADRVEMGRSELASPDEKYYRHVRLRVKSTLTGERSKDLSTSVMVRTAPAEAAETTPEGEGEYIFILDLSGTRTAKVLRATPREIRDTLQVLKMVEDRLPGSEMDVREAALKSSMIVVARIDYISISDGGIGRMSYDPVRLTLVRFLKGKAEGGLSTSIRVRTWPPEKAEATPKTGREYLFFIDVPNPSQSWTVKVMRAGEEEIRAVEKVLKP